MRHVIYILVVLNLVYFAWNRLQHVPEEEGTGIVRHVPPNVRRLETLQEMSAKKVSSAADDSHGISIDNPPVAAMSRRDVEPQGAAEITQIEAQTESEPPGAVSPLRCHVLGPFLTASNMKDVEKRLNELGYQPRERTSDVQEEIGYWVYLPAMEREEAVRITRLLDENGDKDYLIVKGNAISLGVYDKNSQVDVRLKMLHEYGFDPVVESRNKTRTVHWLDIDLMEDERSVLETMKEEFPKIQGQEAACQSIAAGRVFD